MVCDTYRHVADVASIVLVQKFTYRDADEEFSNRYHLNGDAPSDDAGWQAVADGIWDAISDVMLSSVHLVRAYGYTSDTTHAVATIDYTVTPLTPSPGTLSGSGSIAPGDAAVTCRWSTGRTSSSGKPIYLRKYWHPALADSTDHDLVSSAQKTALDNAGTGLLAEIGSTGLFMAGPDGVVPTGSHADQWVTTRTLKRRGRRPPS